MSDWKKEKAIPGGFGGCMNCGYQYDIAPMDMVICVGFGYAAVTKDGQEVYIETDEMEFEDCWTTRDAEKLASQDPDHDWRIILEAPLSGRTYQRHGDDKWMLIERNGGFL